MDDAIKRRLGHCLDLWNSTESVTKQAELIGRQLVLPSINELRYAGRWIVLALGAMIKGEARIDAITSVDDALSYACLCCMQAKHDAIDSIVLHLHEKIDQITDRYTPRIIAMYVKDFDHFLAETAEVDRAIIMSREERHNRSELYEKITRQHLPRLMDFLARIRSAETVINQAIEEERARELEEQAKHDEIVSNLTVLLKSARGEASSNRNMFYVSLAFNLLFLMIAIVPFVL